MKNWIRLKGIAIVLVTVAILIAAGYFLAAPAIKKAIEIVGTDVNGAKVDVGEVHIDFLNSKIEIRGLAVTNPKSPMTNSVEIVETIAHVDGLKLLLNQVIIRDLSATGIAFDTPRQVSGALEAQDDEHTEETITKKISTTAKENLNKANAAFPELDDVLKQEKLLTIDAQKRLDKNFNEKKKKWAQIQKTLPTQKALKNYEKNVRRIFNTDIKSIEQLDQLRRELQALKKSARTDQENLKQAKSFIVDAQKSLKDDANTLKRAPKKDFERLKKKYSLDQNGAINFSNLIFGNTLTDYAKTAIGWYEKATPYLAAAKTVSDKPAEPERAKGEFIPFPLKTPYPDFLIEHARIDIQLKQGEFDFNAQNITHQQDIQNKPTTLALVSTSAPNLGELNLSGVIDTRQKKSNAEFNFTLNNTPVKALPLLKSKELTLGLENASVNTKGKVEIENKAVKGVTKSQFDNAQFDAKGSNSYTKEVALAINKINNFSVSTDIKGAIDDIDVNINSNLDSQVGNAFKQRLSQKQKEWQAKLEKRLNRELQKSLTKNKQVTNFFNTLLPGVNSDEVTLDQLLSKDLNQYEDILKDKLKETKRKEEEKLKRELNKKLEEEKRKQQEQLEKEKQKQQDKLEDEINKKLDKWL